MIIPKLYGRAGNQCFQISCAIGQAKRMGVGWCVPPNTNDLRIWPHYFLKHLLGKHVAVPGFVTRYYHKEPRHCFDPLPPYNDLTLDGFWQSEKYFDGAKEEIAQALGFNLVPSEYVAVHVRRGDYVTHFSDKHPPLPRTWYVDAIRYCISLGYKKFKCYSDDIAWCYVLREEGGWDFEFSHIKDPLADMRDMYNAAGFIISNSSFSLFPALLRADNPLVVAPAESRWYGPKNSHLETSTLMPERFIKL